MSYKVTGPLAIIAPADAEETDNGGNAGPRYFYEGAIIPAGYNDERCKQLVEEGMLSAEADSGDSEDGVPAKSASKADWEAYARSQGATDEDLDGQTKDDLVSKYGA